MSVYKAKALKSLLMISVALPAAAFAAPVPSYVPPVKTTMTPDYVDDTRGVFVPGHQQYRHQTSQELAAYQQNTSNMGGMPSLADAPRQLAANDSYASELERIANEPSVLEAQQTPSVQQQQLAQQQQQIMQQQMMMQQNGMMVPGGYPAVNNMPLTQMYNMQAMPAQMPMMVPQQAAAPMAMPQQTMQQAVPVAQAPVADQGVEMATAKANSKPLDMHNSIVRLKENRITIRRSLQRMMDQIGAGDWVIVWDLAEQNAGLPETEISIQAEEPFMNVMNALLARMQARSGQPLRVIRYDRTNRLVITDRATTETQTEGSKTASVGAKGKPQAVITENVLKESLVSLHYDEIPLVDALENIVHQAGKGEWRLRIYAGTDQVLKPAHIEEPFGVALERLLKLFNLKYEIFPGGKMIVVTNTTRFGFEGVQ